MVRFDYGVDEGRECRAARYFHKRVIIRPTTAPPTAAAGDPQLVQSKNDRPIYSTTKPTANPVTIARKNASIEKTLSASVLSLDEKLHGGNGVVFKRSAFGAIKAIAAHQIHGRMLLLD